MALSPINFSRKAFKKTHIVIFMLLVLIITIGGLYYFKEALFPAKPWPANSKILVYNNSGYSKTFSMVISQWNKAGLPVSFQETSNKHKANVILEDSWRKLKDNCGNPKTCVGWASYIGNPNAYPLVPRQTKVYMIKSLSDEKYSIDRYRASIMMHEFGHVLGLSHGSSDCSIMNSSQEYQNKCFSGTSISNYDISLNQQKERTLVQLKYNCGPWEYDIERLEKLYKRKLRIPGKCLVSSSIKK